MAVSSELWVEGNTNRWVYRIHTSKPIEKTTTLLIFGNDGQTTATVLYTICSTHVNVYEATENIQISGTM